VAARSKTWVCDHSLAGIVGSNPTGALDIFLLCMFVCGLVEVQGSPTECLSLGVITKINVSASYFQPTAEERVTN